MNALASTSSTALVRLSRIAGVLLLALLLATDAAVAQDGPVQLRLDAREGESLTYAFDTEVAVHYPEALVPGSDPEQRMVTSMVIVQRTHEVGEDTLTFISEVDEFTADLQMPGMDEAQLEEARRAMEQMQGNSFRMRVLRDGTLAGVSFGGEGEGGGSARIEQSLRQVGFPYLPREAVSVGDEWTDEKRMQATEMGIPLPGELVVSSRTTLRELSRADDSTVARLAVESTFDFEPSAEAQGMEIQMSGSSAQDLRFDVDRGLLLDGRGAQDFTINLTVPGQGSMTIQGTGSQSSRLVD